MIDQSSLRNRLLSRASPADFALLSATLEPFACVHGAIISEADEAPGFAYFLESGMISVVAVSPEGQTAEAGIIGREGFVHPSIILGSDTVPFKIQVQIAGAAHRVPAADLVQAMDGSATLFQTLLRFTHVYGVQAGFSTLSNAVHQVDERLARWLLMCHDRVSTDDLQLTHEFMSIMLSVRRPSVTNAIHVLEGNRFITADRGYVRIIDRAALEAFAEDAYGKPEAEYRRLLGPR